MKRFSLLVVLLLFLQVVTSCKWHLYKQCDPKWGQHKLGTSTNTICSAGCAMSSVAMALISHNISIDSRTIVNPESLNSWLTSHGGYADKDLIEWNSVHVLGKVKVLAITEKESVQKLKDYVSSCHAVIANVRHGSHWVLLTGFAGGEAFFVNDPGFDQRTYTRQEMLRFVIYSF